MCKTVRKNLVSVIIPTYNSSLYLSRSIQSALSQNYPYIEVIVVDDGSTDATRSIAMSFEDRIKYIYKENGGPASARNLGIQHSSGEYIAFLDADDYWIPGKLFTQINYLEQNPQYYMVHSNAVIDEPGKEFYPTFIDMKPDSGNIFVDLFKDNLVNNLTVVAKRSCIEEVNGFDESREMIGIEDYDLWLRIALKYGIGYLHKIVAVYNIHGNNISNEYKIIKSQLFLIHKYIKNFPWIEAKYPGLIEEKLERVLFRYACLLMQEKKYSQARRLFLATFKRTYLMKASIAGIITSILGTNIFFKDRVMSLKYKQYGNHLRKLGNRKEALEYFLKAVRLYPIQKSIYRLIINTLQVKK